MGWKALTFTPILVLNRDRCMEYNGAGAQDLGLSMNILPGSLNADAQHDTRQY